MAVFDGRGPQRAYGARPAYARANSGAPMPQAGAALRWGRAAWLSGGGPPCGITITPTRPFHADFACGQTARPPRSAFERGRLEALVDWAMSTLQEQFGNIDIYLFDQLLKGNIAPGMSVLDAGCGRGRNLVYLLREGYEVYAADPDRGALESVRALAAKVAPAPLPAENFRVEAVEALSFPDACAGLVICNTVLHFARDDAHFAAMLDGAWRVLTPGGLFFSRLGSTVGMEGQLTPLGGRRYKSPDGSERYLVDAPLLEAHTRRLGAELAEPIKTTVVHNFRAMTTWILRKAKG